jgi:hypothetical protein
MVDSFPSLLRRFNFLLYILLVLVPRRVFNTSFLLDLSGLFLYIKISPLLDGYLGVEQAVDTCFCLLLLGCG